MSRVFLAPVDDESYRATLESEIDLRDWTNRPSDFPKQARVWGVRTDPDMGDWKRNRSSLDKMSKDDPILFYSKGEFFARGRVGVLCETEYIREHYWDGGPAINVFSVDEYDEDLKLKRTELNDILGYSEHFHPQGLWLINQERPVEDLLDRVNMDT
jgi:hypothetical protein